MAKKEQSPVKESMFDRKVKYIYDSIKEKGKEKPIKTINNKKYDIKDENDNYFTIYCDDKMIGKSHSYYDAIIIIERDAGDEIDVDVKDK
jgi:hypothetical protein